MTISKPLPPISFPPTSAQFALALLVLKSKPVESSLEDHVFQLRRCVRPGARATLRHLDSCAFWKEAYETVEVAHGRLLNENQELRHQLEQLRNDTCRSKVADTQGRVRRAKKDKEIQEAIGLLEGTSTIVGDSKSSISSSAMFAKNLFTLRRKLSAGGSDQDALALCLKRTCASANETLCESIKSLVSTPAAGTKAGGGRQAAFGNQTQVLHALHLSCPSLLQAVKKLNSRGGADHCGVYSLVQLFQNILNHLHTIAVVQANRTCTQIVSPIKEQPLPTPNLHETCLSLTNLAIWFFEALDLSHLSHNRVLEGLLCVFLDHLGSSLSLIVFADIDVPMPKTARLGVLPPRGLLDTLGLDQNVAIGATQYEACYLVTILRHLSRCVDKNHSILKFESVAFRTLRKSSAISDNSFAARIWEKLQNTLLRGVFGNEDGSFKDALERSVLITVDSDINDASIDGEEPGEWFIGEVWRLLGWNVLT